jgi:hypothetical protein
MPPIELHLHLYGMISDAMPHCRGRIVEHELIKRGMRNLVDDTLDELATWLAVHDARRALRETGSNPWRICADARAARFQAAYDRKVERAAMARARYLRQAIVQCARAGAYTLGKRVYVEHCVRCVLGVETPPAEVIDAMLRMQSVWLSRQTKEVPSVAPGQHRDKLRRSLAAEEAAHVATQIFAATFGRKGRDL